MSRKTRTQIVGRYDRLQRRKRHVAEFDGDILNPSTSDRITRALAEVSA